MKKYRLLWQDLFEKDGRPDESIWTIEQSGHGFGNAEAQYYTDRLKNVYIENQILHLVAHKENFENRKYTSAKLITLHKKPILYGRVEVKAKIPQGGGTWPAIWFLGENMKEVGWPMCGEIDLMEHVGNHQDFIHFSLHSKTYNHMIGNQPTKVIELKNATKEFIEYAVEWDEDEIRFYTDQTLHAAFKKEKNADQAAWPFNKPFYLILNLAIGGTWGGWVDDSIFPVTFDIKYVKVYERSDV